MSRPEQLPSGEPQRSLWAYLGRVSARVCSAVARGSHGPGEDEFVPEAVGEKFSRGFIDGVNARLKLQQPSLTEDSVEWMEMIRDQVFQEKRAARELEADNIVERLKGNDEL